MPARVMPTGGRADPAMAAEADPVARMQKRQQTSQLTVAISLASLFDFEKTGFVSKENWTKGMTTLMMEELGMDPKVWAHLVDIHGSKDMQTKGQLDVNKLTDVVPIDPRVAVLLNAIVKGLVGMRDFVARSTRREVREADIKRNRCVLNVRRKIMAPCLTAWRDMVRENKKIFRRSAHHARYYAHFKAWRTWKDNVELARMENIEAKKKERQMKRVKGAVQRLQNGKLSAAWK